MADLEKTRADLPELLKYWRTFPAPSNEVAAADIIELLDRELRKAQGQPVDMLLFCPRCQLQHVDSPEPEKGWTNPPHATHTCKGCGLNWRPSNALTNGVAGLASSEQKHVERFAASDPRLFVRNDRPARRFPICKDHVSAEWNQPTLNDDDCILCRLFYLEAQEGLLEEWQQRAKRAEDAIAEIKRPLDEQMARLNATVTRLNEENDRLRSEGGAR